MTTTLSQDPAKAMIGRAIKNAIDEGLGTFAQNAAAVAVMRKMRPELEPDVALAIVLRWRRDKSR